MRLVYLLARHCRRADEILDESENGWDLLVSKRDRDEEKMEASVKSLRDDIDKRLDELKVQIDDIQEKAVKSVSEQPALALGVAFVAGMALGVALSKAGE